jgi:hypothetical protein
MVIISIRVDFTGQRRLNQLCPPIPSWGLKQLPRQLRYLKKICIKVTPYRTIQIYIYKFRFTAAAAAAAIAAAINEYYFQTILSYVNIIKNINS